MLDYHVEGSSTKGFGKVEIGLAILTRLPTDGS